MNTRIITIDGPSGTGKSTVARQVAAALDFAFLDTGALYRGAALAVAESGVDITDGEACAQVVSRTTMDLDDGHLILNGIDASTTIRENRISKLASVVAAHPEVRAALLDIQRNFAAEHPTVVEGRDTGSVIFPYAPVKIFLSATNEERARRRWLELQHKGIEIELEKVMHELEERDQRDSSRAVAPLCIPEKATVVDTTHLSLGEVIENVVLIAKKGLTD